MGCDAVTGRASQIPKGAPPPGPLGVSPNEESGLGWAPPQGLVRGRGLSLGGETRLWVATSALEENLGSSPCPEEPGAQSALISEAGGMRNRSMCLPPFYRKRNSSLWNVLAVSQPRKHGTGCPAPAVGLLKHSVKGKISKLLL